MLEADFFNMTLKLDKHDVGEVVFVWLCHTLIIKTLLCFCVIAHYYFKVMSKEVSILISVQTSFSIKSKFKETNITVFLNVSQLFYF